ncbi:hypothetical protein J437_LFUL011716 [Ladona fulva]|uniref:Uncharacterized protein n=1 Tax=Ladona fulva TaxID=123851 RepID=A0A8K0KBH0_LADFU|nr:hypothetical protein J437_LFUL011716 [Ladona fulva]
MRDGQHSNHHKKRDLLSLKRTPTFATLLRKEVFNLRTFDPMFRYSLTRLPEEEGEEGKTAEEGREGRCSSQWANVRSAVDRVVLRCVAPKEPSKSPLLDGELASLHSDVRVLLRTEAGVFIFEYLKDKLLPGAAEGVLEEVRKRIGIAGEKEEHRKDGEELDCRKLCSALSAVWENFYSHSLPLLEAIFYQVKSRNLGIRQAGLIMFRDHVVLKLGCEIETLLKSYDPAGDLNRRSKKEGVNECCPPSTERLKLEQLVARAVTPYLGFRGLYEGGNPEPTKPSQELEVIYKRRPSVVDPRRLSRPLSVVAGGHPETLSELFHFSADRMRHKKASHRHTNQHDL